jgi:hypothetical protein
MMNVNVLGVGKWCGSWGGGPDGGSLEKAGGEWRAEGERETRADEPSSKPRARPRSTAHPTHATNPARVRPFRSTDIRPTLPLFTDARAQRQERQPAHPSLRCCARRPNAPKRPPSFRARELGPARRRASCCRRAGSHRFGARGPDGGAFFFFCARGHVCRAVQPPLPSPARAASRTLPWSRHKGPRPSPDASS